MIDCTKSFAWSSDLLSRLSNHFSHSPWRSFWISRQTRLHSVFDRYILCCGFPLTQIHRFEFFTCHLASFYWVTSFNRNHLKSMIELHIACCSQNAYNCCLDLEVCKRTCVSSSILISHDERSIKPRSMIAFRLHFSMHVDTKFSILNMPRSRFMIKTTCTRS